MTASVLLEKMLPKLEFFIEGANDTTPPPPKILIGGEPVAMQNGLQRWLLTTI